MFLDVYFEPGIMTKLNAIDQISPKKNVISVETVFLGLGRHKLA